MRQDVLDGASDLVGGFIDIAEAVGFIDDHQIPSDGFDLFGLVPCELVGGDDDLLLLEGIVLALFYFLI